MIKLRRLSGQFFVLNADLIKSIEETPDTLITLTTGEKMMVKESVDQVTKATLDYRQLCVVRFFTEVKPPEAEGEKE
jgi:flagellar protein FlbD